MSWLTQLPIAHRGLFDNKSHPENSIAAFKEAIAFGFGIELDVHLSDSGQLFVHHDFNLLRSCKKHIRIEDVTLGNRNDFRLFSTDEIIPTLEEVLAVINGTVPLVIELKSRGDCTALCQKTAALLDTYSGQYCIESFDPKVVSWFYKNRPAVLRGQLAEYPLFKYFKGAIKRMKLQYVQENRPDFIAYCIFEAPNKYIEQARKLLPNTELVLWTIRKKKQMEKAKQLGAGIIFEKSALE